jgi:hypothetical protein
MSFAQLVSLALAYGPEIIQFADRYGPYVVAFVKAITPAVQEIIKLTGIDVSQLPHADLVAAVLAALNHAPMTAEEQFEVERHAQERASDDRGGNV